MKNPFRKRRTLDNAPSVNLNVVNVADSTDREAKLFASLQKAEAALAAVTSERDELAVTNNRRSLRIHGQLHTKDTQTPEERIGQLLNTERRLLAVESLLSGAAVSDTEHILRQLGNRLGMSSPTLERIYGRMDSLQSLAPLRDKLRQALSGIDWDADVTFEYPEDREDIEEALKLLR